MGAEHLQAALDDPGVFLKEATRERGPYWRSWLQIRLRAVMETQLMRIGVNWSDSEKFLHNLSTEELELAVDEPDTCVLHIAMDVLILRRQRVVEKTSCEVGLGWTEYEMELRACCSVAQLCRKLRHSR